MTHWILKKYFSSKIQYRHLFILSKFIQVSFPLKLIALFTIIKNIAVNYILS